METTIGCDKEVLKYKMLYATLSHKKLKRL